MHEARPIDSASAALIFNLFPLISMAVAVALGHERWQLRRVLGLGVALAGVAVCVGPGIRTGSPDYLLGAGLVFMAATAGAVSSVLSRPVLQGVSPLGFAVRAFVAQDQTRPVPVHLRNAPTQLMKDLDYGKHYRYAHDEAGGFAAGERYLPDGMADPGFYRPVERGLEIRIADKLRELKNLNNQKN